MKNQIDNIEIKNFKTLKNVKFECKKINVFIGKPNVGKSNLLEALSLLGAPYANYSSNNFLSEFIRYKKLEDVFYDKEIGNQIEVNTNIGFAILRYHFNINQFDLTLANDDKIKKIIKLESGNHFGSIDDKFREYVVNNSNSIKRGENLISPAYFTISSEGRILNQHSVPLVYWSPVKKYDFDNNLKEFPDRFHWFLKPGNGSNLYTIIQKNKRLYREINNLFKEYKLRFILDSGKTHFFLQKLVSGIGINFDYNGVADTLRRYVFHLLAIETNENSILLFEEPESHSFPPYIRELAIKITESKTNQFFITTHSPFILNTILENADLKDISVFKVSYDKFQTKVTPLAEKEISKALNYGNDIIFNL